MNSKDNEYVSSLNSLIQTIEQIQVKTVMSANSLMLWAYWCIGNELSRKINSNKWGAKVIENYSADLKQKFPSMKGLSVRNLVYMRQFAENYPSERIIALNNIWEQVKSNTQPVVALIENIEKENNKITQPLVAQIHFGEKAKWDVTRNVSKTIADFWDNVSALYAWQEGKGVGNE